MSVALDEVSTLGFLTGGSEMGALIRAHDWPASPLGPPEGWPQPLKTLVGVMLAAGQPMFVAWGPERTLLYNDSYVDIIASKHPHALGRDFLKVWYEIPDFLEPVVAEAYAGRPVRMDDVELTVERKGFPELAHFAFSFTPVRDEDGQVGGFFCAAMETTGQVLAERRLTAERDRQRKLFEQAPGFITILSGPELRFEFVNDAYDRLFGRRGFVGKTVREAFPDLVGQPFFDLLDNAYATGERFVASAIPIRLQATPDAEPADHFLDFIYEPVRDEHGNVTGIFIEGHDVTKRVRAEHELREREGRYRQIVEGAEDFAILALDEQGVITAWNSGAERLIGRSAEEAIGQSGAIIFTPEDQAAGAVEREMSGAKTDGRASNERWHIRKDGSRFWGSGLMMRLDEEAGGYLKIFRDRTAEHQTEARRAALVQLGDAIRDVENPDDLAYVAAEILGRTLGVTRAGYGAIDARAETITIARDWNAPGNVSVAGTLSFRDFGSYIDALKRGEPVVVADVRTDPRTAMNAATFAAVGACSFVNFP